jgi:hypothetical protein
MRSALPPPGTGNRGEAVGGAGEGRHLHRHPGCHQAHGLGRSGPMQSRRGGTSRLYGGPDQASSSRFDGVQLTKEFQGMRKQISGSSLRQKNRTHTVWNGYRPGATDAAPSHTSRARSREKKWAEA